MKGWAPAAPSPLPPSGGAGRRDSVKAVRCKRTPAGLGLDRVGAPCYCHCLLWGFHKMHPALLCRGKFLPKTPQVSSDRMHIKTILNRIEKQPGFIYDTCRWRDSGPQALVIMEMAVNWGLGHRNIDGITAIGIDEICWRKRKDKFITLVYQLDQGKRRLLWIGPDRTAKTFREFFDWLGTARSRQLRFICSDMWKPYLAVIAEKAAGAVNILDRFHIMSHMSKAIDEVRADETKELKKKGKEPILTKSRWCLLKRPENLTDNQVDRLKDLLACNLRTIRAYLLKEDFQRFWRYSSPAWAGKFLDAWCTRTMRSKIKPMKKVAKMLRAHRSLLLNWFRAKNTIALGCVEGFNNKAKVVTKRSYGFRTHDGLKISLYHALGDLPTPKATHRFC